ncbi:MAG: restriction endonuclease [Acidobacteriota bacterium]
MHHDRRPPELPATVLIVEDDAWTSDLLSTRLREAGMSPIRMHSPEGVAEFAKSQNFDMVVMDLTLGPDNEFGVLGALKNLKSSGVGSFVVAYSAFAGDSAERARQLGADVVLAKTDFSADVSKMLDGWKEVTAAKRLLEDEPEFSLPGLIGPDGRPLSPGNEPPRVVVESLLEIDAELIRRAEAEPDLLRQISPRRFEELVAEILEKMGYHVELTPPTADGGFDLVAAKNESLGELVFLVECKRYVPPRKVGVELIRSLHGVLEHSRATGAMLVTSSHFTRGAADYQKTEKHRLKLSDYQTIRGWLNEVLL